jgi:hypothetical protein
MAKLALGMLAFSALRMTSTEAIAAANQNRQGITQTHLRPAVPHTAPRHHSRLDTVEGKDIKLVV